MCAVSNSDVTVINTPFRFLNLTTYMMNPPVSHDTIGKSSQVCVAACYSDAYLSLVALLTVCAV